MEVELIKKPPEEYNAAALPDKVLRDDWRIAAAWYATGDKERKQRALRYGVKIADELVSRGNTTFHFDAYRDKALEFARRVFARLFRRGLYLVAPHAELIHQGSKRAVVKSRFFEPMFQTFHVLLSGNRAWGFIRFDKPREISLDEFRELKRLHKVTDDERETWWPGAKRLWFYPIRDYLPFERPIKVKVPSGVQTFVKSVKVDEEQLDRLKVPEIAVPVPDVPDEASLLIRVFGFGTREDKFRVTKPFSFTVKPGDRVLIVGPSGSGKSKILSFLRERLKVSEPQPEPDKTFLAHFDLPPMEAMRLAAKVGLAEVLFQLTPYKDLSDGQKARFRLALGLHSSHRFLLFDRFLEELDQLTAAATGFTFARAVKESGKILIAASHSVPHQFPYNVLISLENAPEVKVSRTEDKIEPPQLPLKIRTLQKGEAGPLLRWHHRAHSISFPRGGAVGVINDQPIALAVWSHPQKPFRLARFFETDEQGAFVLLRFVVHPNFRGVGIGGTVLKRAIEMAFKNGAKLCFVLARMGLLTPGPFKRAGMELLAVDLDSPEKTAVRKRLRDLGYSPEFTFRDFNAWWSSLSQIKRNEVDSLIERLGKTSKYEISRYAMLRRPFETVTMLGFVAKCRVNREALREISLDWNEAVEKLEGFDIERGLRNLSYMSDFALVRFHGYLHQLFDDVWEPGRPPPEDVVNAHTLVVKEMERRGLEHRWETILDTFSLERSLSLPPHRWSLVLGDEGCEF